MRGSYMKLYQNGAVLHKRFLKQTLQFPSSYISVGNKQTEINMSKQEPVYKTSAVFLI